MAEDEPRLQEVIKDYLDSKEMQTTIAQDGEEALYLFELHKFDMVLLDVMMPKMDGFSLCRKIRKISDVPIIFLTARCSEDDQVFGFELGADDYVTKPFSLPVLYAKCVALISRTKGANKMNMIELGSLKININTRQVYVKDKEIILPPKEYALLLCFIENKDIILSREQLLNQIWGYDYYGDSRVVDTHIKKLRKALGSKSDCIKTIIKVGYQFVNNDC